MITIKTNSGTVRIGENRGQLNVNRVVINGKPINLDELPIELDAGNGNVVITGTDAPIDIQMGGKRPEPFVAPSAIAAWLSPRMTFDVTLSALSFVFAGIALSMVSSLSWAWFGLIMGVIAAFLVYSASDHFRPKP